MGKANQWYFLSHDMAPRSMGRVMTAWSNKALNKTIPRGTTTIQTLMHLTIQAALTIQAEVLTR